ncbi:MAG: hypothetical protein U0939_24340 [Pirellulales bacterium]
MKRLQFSLTTTMVALTAVAGFCAIDRLVPGFPYSILLPAMLLTVACETARNRDLPELTWSLIAIAWMTASYQFVKGIEIGLPSNTFPSHQSTVSGDFHFLSLTYVAAVGLPLLLTLPAIWLASPRSQRRPSPGLKWIKWCVWAVIVDLHVMVLSLAIIFATRPHW